MNKEAESLVKKCVCVCVFFLFFSPAMKMNGSYPGRWGTFCMKWLMSKNPVLGKNKQETNKRMFIKKKKKKICKLDNKSERERQSTAKCSQWTHLQYGFLCCILIFFSLWDYHQWNRRLFSVRSIRLLTSPRHFQASFQKWKASHAAPPHSRYVHSPRCRIFLAVHFKHASVSKP